MIFIIVKLQHYLQFELCSFSPYINTSQQITKLHQTKTFAQIKYTLSGVLDFTDSVKFSPFAESSESIERESEEER